MVWFAGGSAVTEDFVRDQLASAYGTGALKTGWAHVHADQPIGGAGSFGVRDSAGNQLTDVGVSPSIPGTEFTIFADSIGESQTGVALANPTETAMLTLEFELNRADGTTVASRQRTLAPLGHLAIFLFELFEGVEGIAELSMVIRSVAGVRPAAARGTIDPDFDGDVWRFEGTAGQNIVIEATVNGDPVGQDSRAACKSSLRSRKGYPPDQEFLHHRGFGALSGRAGGFGSRPAQQEGAAKSLRCRRAIA